MVGKLILCVLMGRDNMDCFCQLAKSWGVIVGRPLIATRSSLCSGGWYVAFQLKFIDTIADVGKPAQSGENLNSISPNGKSSAGQSSSYFNEISVWSMVIMEGRDALLVAWRLVVVGPVRPNGSDAATISVFSARPKRRAVSSIVRLSGG
ncbi:hypothetical protein NPIL_533241 [Nephila pilipes]|uniref:Uncharacterized protein n=1 Tax=Nephila pilipes TaxID=299642 RepID=A0A8X6U9B5_NEPPI|nr:hypothetical protein NPIL_533241 [Nephila pilipes]